MLPVGRPPRTRDRRGLACLPLAEVIASATEVIKLQRDEAVPESSSSDPNTATSVNMFKKKPNASRQGPD